MSDSISTDNTLNNQPVEKIDLSSMSYNEQFTYKQNFLKNLLSPFFNGELDAYSSPEKHYRMRAEFRVWHDGPATYHIMFDQSTKQQYRVDQLPAASILINNAMQSVMAFLNLGTDEAKELRAKLFQVDYLSSTSGEIVISMLYHKVLSDEWEACALKLKSALSESLSNCANVDIIGRARKVKRLINRDYINEALKINQQHYTFKQVENSFTQPNAAINIDMIEWVSKNGESKNSDLLELYCGAGNFSVPLSHYFRNVLATEISKTSVNAAQENITNNNISNLKIARLSSEEFVEAYNKTREFNRLADIRLDDYDFKTVLVDPPRAGLDDGTLDLISRFDVIIYVSCNPSTLIENLNTLNKTHKVVHAALFDQFPFTEHIESGLILKRR
ncbi:tRNA (uridine(54)-C5)-methyltransferase TrmA [Glaciecola sp. 2405UD65-10]|uniref:tRNA (uridine(54)-C5)-methyltransferase TrmA n=1 Tax=Glaciecola sp. 2405UD65-10 TaxID=3397244 RepID=UPI003B5CC648